MKNQKILITGGAGFIGSHLAEELARKNEVSVLDNFHTGTLENLAQNEGLKISNVDISNPLLVKESMGDIDYVFHLAAMTSVPESFTDPITYNQVNINGTFNVLKSALEHGVKKVVFSSSAAVYGDNPINPKSEDMVTSPLSPYAVSKVAGENYCNMFGEMGLGTVCLRYFNVYGPRQSHKHAYASLIPKSIHNMLNSIVVTIYGDGTQTRDFVYVKDIVNANILAAESSKKGVFNIGTGKEVSVNTIINTLKGRLDDKSISMQFEPPREGDILKSCADITKARNELKFKPSFSLEKGLKETLEYFLSTKAIS